MTKRVFDVTVATAALVILLPLFLIIAVVIKVDSPGPVFFRQMRMGLHCQSFLIHKFRTMQIDQGGSIMEITVSGDPRITRVGRFLRHYKIDELPQLIDILLGDMSFVGPRPETLRYVEFYSEQDKKVIFSVRPGLTDWASILYISESKLLNSVIDPENMYIKQILPKKINLYHKYVKERSFFNDLSILFHTAILVLQKK
jgi:lipopolysaccharide/colanic/teichoic acid biosynthesis glycosyltransferase